MYESNKNINRAPALQGDNVTLRGPKEQDIEDIVLCGRHKEIVRMYGGDTRNIKPLTREDVVARYQETLATPLEWMIEYQGRWIGTARLTVNEPDKKARYAVGIADISKLGKGLGTEVTRLVLDYAFNTLKLHRIDLRVLEYNKRAIACYKKCGFIKEGIEREDALIEGKWESDVMMSILEQEYKV
jgi:RimJ/RimL family protein N-acetyltransferase